jgi:hypothetical protein
MMLWSGQVANTNSKRIYFTSAHFMPLFRRSQACSHLVLISDAKLTRGKEGPILVQHNRYRSIQQRFLKCRRVRKDRCPSHAGKKKYKHPVRAQSAVCMTKRGDLPVKYAKRIRNRETLERQCLADLSRARRSACLLVKSRLGEGRCCVRAIVVRSQGA